MKNIEQIVQLLTQTQYKEIDSKGIYLADLGSKALDLLLAKVTYVKIKDPQLYEIFKDNISEAIIKQVDFLDSQTFHRCMGHLIVTGGYNKLSGIQMDIERYLKMAAKSVHKMNEISKIRDMSRTQNETELSLSIISSSSSSSKNVIMSPTKTKNRRQKQPPIVDFDLFQHLEDIQEPGQTFYQNFSKIEKNSSYLFQMSEYEIMKLPIAQYQIDTPITPEQYLKKYVKSYNSEFNLLTQKFAKWEIPKPSCIYQQDMDNNQIAIRSLIIPRLLNWKDGKIIKIEHRGMGNNKKQAQNISALKILRDVYENFPNIFQKVLEIRKTQNLNT